MADPCCTVNHWDRRKHAPGCRFYRSALSRLLSFLAGLVVWVERDGTVTDQKVGV